MSRPAEPVEPDHRPAPAPGGGEPRNPSRTTVARRWSPRRSSSEALQEFHARANTISLLTPQPGSGGSAFRPLVGHGRRDLFRCPEGRRCADATTHPSRQRELPWSLCGDLVSGMSVRCAFRWLAWFVGCCFSVMASSEGSRGQRWIAIRRALLRNASLRSAGPRQGSCRQGSCRSDQTKNRGALMEPSGRNRRQPLAHAHRSHAA